MLINCLYDVFVVLLPSLLLKLPKHDFSIASLPNLNSDCVGLQPYLTLIPRRHVYTITERSDENKLYLLAIIFVCFLSVQSEALSSGGREGRTLCTLSLSFEIPKSA